MQTDRMLLQENWRIAHDPQNVGWEEGWMQALPDTAVAARVPGWVHLSLPDAFGIAWYQVHFRDGLRDGGRRLLRFACATYLTQVYLNGQLVGEHRGCEDPFVFDVTDAMAQENCLTVRVSKPYGDEIVDGYRFGEIPHRNERKDGGLTPGSCFNTFGIGGKVELLRVPEIYIEDLYVCGEGDEAVICATVANGGQPCQIPLVTDIVHKRDGEIQVTHRQTVDLPQGVSEHTWRIPIAQVRLWDVKDPFLYTAQVRIEGNDGHGVSKNFGFRTFVVDEKGWFRLNGRRIFLKCAHTGNFFPGGNNMPLDGGELWRQDLVKAKACGFNMVRFISGAAYPEQLDFCDELGLMVYEEPVSGWLTENGERSQEIFFEDMLRMVKRDRSHACLTVFGMLNETKADEVYGDFVRAAIDCLPHLRKIDPTRLVLLSSGRFDGYAKVGSLANPYQNQWQTLWNGEDEQSEQAIPHSQNLPQLLGRRIGDMHAYPTLPLTDADETAILSVGHEYQRPVFFSEYGTGSLLNTTHARLRYEMEGVPGSTPDHRMIRRMDEQFMQQLKEYGLDEIYPYPIELLRESERMHNQHRLKNFNQMRSNPYINGYSVTGLVDHSICGEGLWNLMREFKPGIADTVERGFAPLRWCLFVKRTHVYRGRRFSVRGVLANEDVLTVGQEYPIRVCITGESGVVWHKEYTVSLTEEMTQGMSFPVFDEEIVLDVPEGQYHLRAEILEHATAADGCIPFYLSDPAATAVQVKAVYAYGLSDNAEAFLRGQGVDILPFAQASPHALILIGEITPEERESVWMRAFTLAKQGARVLALDSFSFIKDEDWEGWLPMADRPDNAPHMERSLDWLYHLEYIAKKHPYFEGMPCGRIMDWDYYMNLIRGRVWRGGVTPDDVAAASVSPGYCNLRGYEGGLNLGTYRMGEGALILNNFNILGEIGRNPAADRLLANILNEESRRR